MTRPAFIRLHGLTPDSRRHLKLGALVAASTLLITTLGTFAVTGSSAALAMLAGKVSPFLQWPPTGVGIRPLPHVDTRAIPVTTDVAASRNEALDGGGTVRVNPLTGTPENIWPTKHNSTRSAQLSSPTVQESLPRIWA